MPWAFNTASRSSANCSWGCRQSPREPHREYRGIMLADPRDIAVMKVIAIGGRGSRKDFIDLYCLLKVA